MVSPEMMQDVLLNLVRHQTADDLTVRQLCLLALIQKTPGTVRGLAESMNIAKPAITRAADKLADYGFLLRHDDPKDRRSVLLVITAEGKKFFSNLTRER